MDIITYFNELPVMSHVYILSVISIMTLATFLCRSMPFFTLKSVASHPIILFIGKNLPPMIMMLLLMYSLADVDFSTKPYGFNDIVCTIIAIGLYLTTRNPLVAISISTGLFMYLKQTGFMLF